MQNPKYAVFHKIFLKRNTGIGQLKVTSEQLNCGVEAQAVGWEQSGSIPLLADNYHTCPEKVIRYLLPNAELDFADGWKNDPNVGGSCVSRYFYSLSQTYKFLGAK